MSGGDHPARSLAPADLARLPHVKTPRVLTRFGARSVTFGLAGRFMERSPSVPRRDRGHLDEPIRC